MPGTFSITEVKDANSVILGLGRFGIGTYTTVPATTFTDIGYIKGVEMTYNRELKEFQSAGVIIKRIVFRDTFSCKVTWAEVSLKNMQLFFGGTLNSPPTILKFGGHRTLTRRTVRFEHLKDDGNILRTTVFKCIPGGEFTMAYAEEEYVTVPGEFSAEEDTSQPLGQRYAEIALITV
jgi:hypothetical protein